MAKTRKFDLDRFLKKAKTAVKEGAEKAKENKGFEEYDDGTYSMKLTGAEIGPSQSSGRIQVTLIWKFLDGDYKGKTHRTYQGVGDNKGNPDPDGIYYFMLDAKRLGYEVDELEASDIPDLLKQMKKDKPIIRGRLKTNGEYQNLRIVKLLDESDIEEDDDDGDEDDDKKKKKSKSKKDDDEDEDEEEDEDDEEEEEEEEEEKPRRKKSKKSKDEEEDEEESEDDEEEEEEDDDDEDDKKSRRRRGRKSKKDEDDEEEEEEDDDDEEEEEEKPRKKKRGKKGDDDEEEEEESEEDEDEEEGDLAVTVGSRVKVKLKDGVVKAEVTEILDKDNAVKIKTKDGRTVKVSAEKIQDVIDTPKKSKKK